MFLKYTERELTLRQITAGHVLDNARIILDAQGYTAVKVDASAVTRAPSLMTIAEGNEFLTEVVAVSSHGHRPTYGR